MSEQQRDGQRAVYILRDPRCQSVRYVGQTGQPRKRLSFHVSDARSQNGPTPNVRGRWIQGLLAEGLRPVLEVVEWCPEESAVAREGHWIRHYHAEGCSLTNKFGLVGEGSYLARDVRVSLEMELWQSGIRRLEVARVMGLRQNVISAILKGHRRAPDDFLARFREAMVVVSEERYRKSLALAASADEQYRLAWKALGEFEVATEARVALLQALEAVA